MRAGDIVNGCALLEDFRVVGAGLSEWTFAVRDRREFFIKRFLSPTYPDDDAPGSAKTKAAARCAAFEAHHRGILAALAPVTSYGGNLIATLDFFRSGAKYYKVTEKVDLAGLDITDVANLPFPTRLVLLKTVAHSLKILHDLSIVHSDLKPSNVMIKQTELGYTTKLIDFDSSYTVGSPPPPEEIVGTMNYYSPELVRYIQGTGKASELTSASDIFALGLIYAEYLTGAVPTFDPAHHEPAIAVLNGAMLKIARRDLPKPLVMLVEAMMSADPAARPLVSAVHATLMSLRTGPATTRATPRPPVRRTLAPRVAVPTAGTAAAGLRGKGLRLTPSAGRAPLSGPKAAVEPAPSPSARVVPGRGGALLGKLLRKVKERGR